MQTEELIATYSIGADVFLCVLSIIVLTILFVNYVARNKGQTLLIISNILLFTAAMANMLFFTAVKCNFPTVTIFIFRDIYHVVLLWIFVIYIEYVNELAGTNRKLHGVILNISAVICLVASIADCVSPLTHFGLYRENGLWYDSTYLKPFTIAYVLEMTILGFNVVLAGKRIIKSIRQLLMVTFCICVLVVCVENAYDSNTFMAMTFSLPIFVVLVELHSSPYNLVNGARNFSVLSDYIKGRYSSGKKDTYMCLQLYLDDKKALPQELGKAFYSFYDKHFKHAKLFANGVTTYVLVIPENSEKQIEEKACNLINVTFQQHYAKYGIDYKIVVLSGGEFESGNAFSSCLRYWLSYTDNDSYRIIRSSEMEQYKRSLYIAAQLKDIDEKKDLDDERVLTFCQPVKNLRTGLYDTGEALMRLRLPEGGMVFPDQFIPIAEDLGYIHTLSLIILNKTCKAIRAMEQEGYHIERISVNFTTPEMIDDGFIDDFKRVIDANGIAYSRIGVEITESKDDEDYDKLFHTVMQLRELGAMLYLDDFGTGYSNFDRILKLKFDLIKLDRSLLLMSDEQDEAETSMQKGNYDNSMLLSWFTKTFANMGYKVLCEGVETDDQENRCVTYGMTYLQGYKYSKPIPIENMRNFFAK